MKNPPQQHFIKNFILAVVITIVAAFGLISMPYISSAASTTTGTTTVEVVITGVTLNLDLKIVTPPSGLIVNSDTVPICVDYENIDEIKVYVDSVSSPIIHTEVIQDAGIFSGYCFDVVLPSNINNGSREIILVGNSYSGTSNTITDSVMINFLGAQPRIDSVSPSSGPTIGKTVITINGENFTPTSEVTIGGKPCLNVIFVNQQTLKCTTPAHEAGNVAITVTNPNVTTPNRGSYTMLDAFRYVKMDVLVPDTGLFRIGNKMVSLYELIGGVVLLAALICGLLFLILGKKKQSKKNRKNTAKTKKKARK